MSDIMRLSRIEGKPKRVEFLQSYRDTIGLGKRPELLAALEKIIDCIKKGQPLPAGSYRTSSKRDELLELEGVMHLHLGDSKTRELVYLVQFPDHVVLLEISDHYHFTTNPKGSVLKTFHGKKLNAHIAKRARERQMRQLAIKAGIKPRVK